MSARTQHSSLITHFFASYCTQPFAAFDHSG